MYKSRQIVSAFELRGVLHVDLKLQLVLMAPNSSIPGLPPSLVLLSLAPILAHVHTLLVPVVFTKGGILNNSGLLDPAL